MKNVLISFVSAAVLIGAFLTGYTLGPADKAAKSFSGIELGVCTITQTKVTIGHQLSKEVLAEDPSRQWAIIQQPLNATNTVSLSISGDAVSGSGYTLATTTANQPTELVLGFSTDLRTDNAVEAITSTGSTTINVIDCK